MMRLHFEYDYRQLRTVAVLNGRVIGWLQHYKNPPIEFSDGDEEQWVFHTQTPEVPNLAANSTVALKKAMLEHLEPIYADVD